MAAHEDVSTTRLIVGVLFTEAELAGGIHELGPVFPHW